MPKYKSLKKVYLKTLVGLLLQETTTVCFYEGKDYDAIDDKELQESAKSHSECYGYELIGLIDEQGDYHLARKDDFEEV